MNGLARRADLPTMTSADDGETTGQEIQRRFDALGFSDREWHRKTGIDRKTLNRAMADDPKVRNATYTAILSELGKWEAVNAGKAVAVARPVGDPADDLMEISVEGNFGVRVVVKGAVRNADALHEFVRVTIADMGKAETDS